MVVAKVVHMAPHQENVGLDVLGGHLVLHAGTLILLQRLSNLLGYRCNWALHLSLLGSPCTAGWDSREGQSCKGWRRGNIFLLSQSMDTCRHLCLPPTSPQGPPYPLLSISSQALRFQHNVFILPQKSVCSVTWLSISNAVTYFEQLYVHDLSVRYAPVLPTSGSSQLLSAPQFYKC